MGRKTHLSVIMSALIGALFESEKLDGHRITIDLDSCTNERLCNKRFLLFVLEPPLRRVQESMLRLLMITKDY